MTLKLKYKRLLATVLAVALVSCSNPWDDRENNGDSNLDQNLSEAIISTPETSQFGQLLVKTGYDKILSASKTYTVFVPTNEAMSKVDPAILNDAAAVKKFVENHIALTAYSSIRKNSEEKIYMLSTKYLTFKGSTTIGDATIVGADHYAANGVYHIINKAQAVKLNIWEYVNSMKGTSAMSDYLLSLKEISIYKADIAAKATAEPGFLSDSLSNSYLMNVYNLNNEKNSYTFFLMDDAGYTAEVDKMKPYMTISTSTIPEKDSTAIYSKYFTVRDMAFPKAYKKEELPAKLTSRFGVEFDVDKTQIVGEPIELSNGIVYRMKKVNIDLSKRLIPTKIEGERNSGFSPIDLRSKVLYRDRIDPAGVLFNDIMVRNQGVSLFTLIYQTPVLYSTKYKVYWRAINDMQTNVFQQRLQIGGKIKLDGKIYTFTNPIMLFPYMDVPVKNYDPVYIGEFTLDKAGNIFTSLIAANTTTDGNNTLTLDYLNFVPVVK